MDTFKQRKIDVTIYTTGGTDGTPPGNPVVCTGYRCALQMSQAAATTQGTLQLIIAGLPMDLMNQITQVGAIRGTVYNNPILVSAGDVGGSMSTVFEGGIYEAVANFDAMPNVTMNITAVSMVYQAIKPVSPSSYSGPVDAALVFRDIAQSMGIPYAGPDKTGVMLSSPYFPGTDYDKYRACAEAVRGQLSAVIANNRLVVWPRDGHVQGDPILISAARGMVGYPSISRNGVLIRTLFNPYVQLGKQIKVESSFTPACGLFNIFNIVHTLSSETPDGPWFTEIMAYPEMQQPGSVQ